MAKDNGLFGNFNEFVEMCEDIAERMDCSCKVKEYHRYGFNTVSLETDAFGGTFVCFNYDLKTGRMERRERRDIYQQHRRCYAVCREVLQQTRSTSQDKAFHARPVGFPEKSVLSCIKK